MAQKSSPTATRAANTLGCRGTYTDPLWRITVHLTPLEQQLLTHPLLRRLHFVAHAGASRVVTPQTYSRLEHTLGLLCLVAHWAPQATDLRAAALLHDVGHLPLSHTFEGLAGLNHHHLGRQYARQTAGLLEQHGLQLHDIERVLDGTQPSLLVGTSGMLNLDHLDSYVRSGRMNGWLTQDPANLLSAMRLNGTTVDTDAATAATLVDLVCAEAHAHVSWENIAPASVVRHAVSALIDDGHQPHALAALTDDELWTLLLDTPATADVTRRLRETPHLLTARAVPEHHPARTYSLRKIYRSAPLLEGRPLAVAAPQLHTRLAALDTLDRHFAVTWTAGGGGAVC
ncbi:HD domain-containing protein [Streptomyces sp. NPDC059008]|uniref:HD domain-containing protein n=1 Tax=Streptomyces sp. NPDC059008 TaxID=3346693 RepID=UPI0036940BA6